MIYDHWMTYIKDDVPLTKLIIPSAHNAGSYDMHWTACCQDGDVYEQFRFGIRHFCIRLDTDKNGTIVMCHGPTKGHSLESVLQQFERILEDFSDSFILDIREYYPQKIFLKTRHFFADKAKVDKLFARYLNPEKYAYTDFNDVSEITVGDFRKSGKRFILLNYREEYAYSKNCEHIIPWEKQVNGDHAARFVDKTLRFFDDYRTKGLYWFQTQQTPNLGTPIGFRSPRALDRMLRPHFRRLIKGIAENPFYLESANIIAGDFMTNGYMKVKEILSLNLLKRTVKEARREEFEKGLEIEE